MMKNEEADELYPLSGRGEKIIYSPSGRVTWGTVSFILSNSMIKDILHSFFIDCNKWYPLGSSETEPMKGGLGEYIQNKYQIYHQRN